jgi:hypothetical protein
MGTGTAPGPFNQQKLPRRNWQVSQSQRSENEMGAGTGQVDQGAERPMLSLKREKRMWKRGFW